MILWGDYGSTNVILYYTQCNNNDDNAIYCS